jgi:hypothetical protein
LVRTKESVDEAGVLDPDRWGVRAQQVAFAVLLLVCLAVAAALTVRGPNETARSRPEPAIELPQKAAQSAPLSTPAPRATRNSTPGQEANPPPETPGSERSSRRPVATLARVTPHETFLPSVVSGSGPETGQPQGIVDAAPAAIIKVEPLYWGVSLEGVPWDMNRLAAWEQSVAGKSVSIVHFWQFWVEDPAKGLQPFSPGLMDKVRGYGAIPMVTWPSERMSGGTAQPEFALRQISNGTYDQYIRQWAGDAKAWRRPFFLRWGHEMNGHWFPWSETANGNQGGEFVQAWRHIRDMFAEVGAANVSWVWCPNVEPEDANWPDFGSLYPGDEYVDWTCLDGYNWGEHRPEGWMTFGDVFGRSYDQLVQLAPSKSIMIGELGSVDRGGSKAQWISDALTLVASHFPQVKAQVWYNWEFNGVDWRLETAEPSAQAQVAGLAAPHFLSNVFTALDTSPIPPPAYP